MAQVKTFSKACLTAFERRDWRSGLSCVEPQTLQQLKDKYLDTYVLLSYKTILVELQAAFGKCVTRKQLAAMAPLDLLSGGLDGALVNFANSGRRLEHLQLRLQRVEHRIAEIYRVHIRAKLVLKRDKGREFSRRYKVPVKADANSMYMGIPPAILDLLGLE